MRFSCLPLTYRLKTAAGCGTGGRFDGCTDRARSTSANSEDKKIPPRSRGGAHKHHTDLRDFSNIEMSRFTHCMSNGSSPTEPPKTDIAYIRAEPERNWKAKITQLPSACCRTGKLARGCGS